MNDVGGLNLRYAAEQIGCFGGSAADGAPTRSLYPNFYGSDEEMAILVKLRQ